LPTSPFPFLGYTLGMVCTFIAVFLMETAQPALIYLVPFTFFPICLWALLGGDKKDGTFGRMWRGEIYI
jgi:signal peptide peptidase-like protein 2B